MTGPGHPADLRAGQDELTELARKLSSEFPGAPVARERHSLDADMFSLQADKHVARRAEGAAIGTVWLSDGRVVLTCRSVLHPGWALVGGTVERGQRFDEAFVREVREETGLQVTLRGAVMIELKTFVAPDGRELHMPVVMFDAYAATDQLPERTPEAAREGLIVRAFTPDALPRPMILADHAKLQFAIRCGAGTPRA